jgi:hypothetical protein
MSNPEFSPARFPDELPDYRMKASRKSLGGDQHDAERAQKVMPVNYQAPFAVIEEDFNDV